MTLITDNIEHIIDDLHYIIKMRYSDEHLNRLFNYWCLFDEYEHKLTHDTNFSLQTVLYSKYFWFCRFVEYFHSTLGYDAGLEQQLLRHIKDIEQRLGQVDWCLLETLQNGGTPQQQMEIAV